MAHTGTAKWYAAMIRNAQWQKTARVLGELGVACYIPPSYRTLLFLYADKSLALSLVNSGRIHARFLIDHGTRTLLEIPAKQMEDFRRVMEEPEAECAPGTAFAKGDKIRIIRGTLKGVEGEIVETPGGTSLVVRVSTLLCAKISIPRADAAPLE